MARKNITGISFCGLGLDKIEEKILKKYLLKKKISMKRLQRFLVRQHLKQEKLI